MLTRGNARELEHERGSVYLRPRRLDHLLPLGNIAANQRYIRLQRVADNIKSHLRDAFANVRQREDGDHIVMPFRDDIFRRCGGREQAELRQRLVTGNRF